MKEKKIPVVKIERVKIVGGLIERGDYNVIPVRTNQMQVEREIESKIMSLLEDDPGLKILITCEMMTVAEVDELLAECSEDGGW